MNRPRSMFREAREGPVARQIAKTAAQTTVFWLLFLAVFPLAITWVEQRFDAPRFNSASWNWVGWTVLAAASVVGLWSGLTMSRAGRGTPLPIDCPRRLVVSGPYGHIRNPMAMAGLTQGAGVGLVLGSYGVLVYVACGLLVWDYWVRPLEEQDLRHRFGDEYEAYCREVRCWRWRWRRYRPPAS